jgi:hypothetical protein
MPRPKRAARKRTLTELFIKKVKPEKTRFLVWDAKQHGLVLQVEPTGKRAWKCIYSFHGRPRWLHIGKASAIGLSDARRLAAEAMLAVAEGTDPAAEKRAERLSGTFADLAARYVEVAKRKNKSWRQGATLVARYATITRKVASPTSTMSTSTPTRTSTSWRQSRRTSLRWQRGSPRRATSSRWGRGVNSVDNYA